MNDLHYYVVYSFSQDFAHIAATSIYSLLLNNTDKLNFIIYILGENITEKTSYRLRDMSENFGAKLVFVDTTEIKNRIKPIVNTVARDRGFKPTYVTWYRLFAPLFLPNDVDRFVFIGGDTLIAKGIKGMYDFDLKGKSIGMVADACRNEFKKCLGLDDNDIYYNDDIAIIDAKRWREKELTEISLKYLDDNGCNKLPLVEQDLINIALKEEIIRIPPRFAWLSQFWLYDLKGMYKVYGLNENTFYNSQLFKNPPEDVIIHHFNGNSFIRPWYSNSRHPMAKIYKEYYMKTDWDNQGMKNYKQKIEYKIQYFLFKYTPRFVNVFLSMIMQRLFIKLQYNV